MSKRRGDGSDGDGLTHSPFAELAKLEKSGSGRTTKRTKSRAQELAPTPTPKERKRRSPPPKPASELSDEELFAAAVDHVDRAEIFDKKFGSVESVADRERHAKRERAPSDPHEAAAREFEAAMASAGVERMESTHVVADVLRPGLSRTNVTAGVVAGAAAVGPASGPLDPGLKRMLRQARKHERRRGGLPMVSVRGLTSDDALDQVSAFILEHAGHERFVRVITGKGRQSEGEPVLKYVCATLFESRGDVALYAPEVGRDGDFGAYILQLRSD